MTVQVPGPFSVRSQEYQIEDSSRKPLVCGPQIEPVLALVGTGGQHLAVSGLTDGKGLAQDAQSRLMEHDTDVNAMWLSGQDQAVDSIEFDMGKVVPLDLIQAWNYNGPGRTGFGVKKVDVSVWTEAGAWNKVLKDVLLEQADGTDGYDQPTVIRMDAVQAAKVRFDNMVAFDDGRQIGLSEVQFFKPLGKKACKPEPADRGYVNRKATTILRWTPGLDAVRHRVSVGTDANGIRPLDAVDAGVTEVALSGISPGSRYYWRIDEVRTDGSVVQGDLWSFTCGGLLGWWRFDETSGDQAADSSGNGFAGQVSGDPKWVAGKVGGALSFDGIDDYVTLPAAVGSGAGEFTVSVWAYPTRCGSFARFVEFGNGPYDDNIEFARYDTTGSIEARVYAGSEAGSRVQAVDAIEPDAWQFFAMTLDIQGWAKLYKNGKLVGSGQTRVPRDVVRRRNFVGHSNWSWDENYRGLMDDVRVYGQVLSANQILTLYEGQEVTMSVTVGDPLRISVKPGQTQPSVPAVIAESCTADTNSAAKPVVVHPPANKKTRYLHLVAVVLSVMGIVIGVIAMTRSKK